MSTLEQAEVALVFLAIALTVLGGLRFARWFFGEDRRVKGLLAKAQVVKIADALEGSPVKIVGKVRRADKLLEAPASREPCLVWKVTVDRVLRRDQRRVLTQTDATDFWLEDETGSALVKPVLPEVRLAEHEMELFASDCPTQLSTLIETHDRAREGRDLTHVTGNHYKCREGLVTEGETVAVLGYARWVDSADAGSSGDGYRTRKRHLILEDHSPVVLRISDDPAALG